MSGRYADAFYAQLYAMSRARAIPLTSFPPSRYETVEPVLSLYQTSINQRSHARTGGCDAGPPPQWVIVTLALIIALTVLIVVLMARRARGCSWRKRGDPSCSIRGCTACASAN